MNLLESLLALTILLLIVVGVGSVIEDANETARQKKAAQDLLLITKAARQYAKDCQTQLLNTTTLVSGPTLSTASGIPAEILPYMNIGHSGRNVWGQTYQITFRQQQISTDSSTLMVFVTTSGGYQGQGSESTPRFILKNVRGAASRLAGLLDADLANNAYFVAGYISDNGHLVGQSVNLNLDAYQIPNLEEGHLATLTNLLDAAGQGSLQSGDYLYRTEVPGHPELNSMTTSLDMSGQEIDAVGGLNFTAQDGPKVACDEDHLGSVYVQSGGQENSPGLYICKKSGSDFIYQELIDTGSTVLKDLLLLPHGAEVTKPSCVQGDPEIWVSPVAMAKQSDRTPPITAFQAYAENKNLTTWKIILRMQSQADSTWHYPSADVAAAQVITICRPKYPR